MTQLIQFGEDLAAVVGGIDAGVDLRDLTLGIDEEGMARSEFHYGEIGERSVGVGDLVLSVGQELEV